MNQIWKPACNYNMWIRCDFVPDAWYNVEFHLDAKNRKYSVKINNEWVGFKKYLVSRDLKQKIGSKIGRVFGGMGGRIIRFI